MTEPSVHRVIGRWCRLSGGQRRHGRHVGVGDGLNRVRLLIPYCCGAVCEIAKTYWTSFKVLNARDSVFEFNAQKGEIYSLEMF